MSGALSNDNCVLLLEKWRVETDNENGYGPAAVFYGNRSHLNIFLFIKLCLYIVFS